MIFINQTRRHIEALDEQTYGMGNNTWRAMNLLYLSDNKYDKLAVAMAMATRQTTGHMRELCVRMVVQF